MNFLRGWKLHNTLPSYSFLSKTSGAMYAGVPTVDFGCECSTEDCKSKTIRIYVTDSTN